MKASEWFTLFMSAVLLATCWVGVSLEQKPTSKPRTAEVQLLMDSARTYKLKADSLCYVAMRKLDTTGVFRRETCF